MGRPSRAARNSRGRPGAAPLRSRSPSTNSTEHSRPSPCDSTARHSASSSCGSDSPPAIASSTRFSPASNASIRLRSVTSTYRQRRRGGWPGSRTRLALSRTHTTRPSAASNRYSCPWLRPAATSAWVNDSTRGRSSGWRWSRQKSGSAVHSSSGWPSSASPCRLTKSTRRVATSNSITTASMLSTSPRKRCSAASASARALRSAAKSRALLRATAAWSANASSNRCASASNTAPGRAATPSAPIASPLTSNGAAMTVPRLEPLQPRPQLVRIDERRIREHVGRRQRPALQHGAAGQSDAAAEHERHVALGIVAGESQRDELAGIGGQSVDRGLTGAQQREHGVGDELGDHRGVERVSQRLGHRGQRLGLAPPSLTVGVQARALHGERDLGGQRAERVHRLGIGRVGAPHEDAEHPLQGIPRGERHPDEPAHALDLQEVAPAGARVGGGLLHHHGLASAGDVAGQPLTERQVGRQTGVGAFQHAGRAPQQEPLAVQDPHEDEAVGHQLGRATTGGRQQVAEAEGRRHRPGQPGQQPRVDCQGGGGHVRTP